MYVHAWQRQWGLLPWLFSFVPNGRELGLLGKTWLGRGTQFSCAQRSKSPGVPNLCPFLMWTSVPEALGPDTQLWDLCTSPLSHSFCRTWQQLPKTKHFSKGGGFSFEKNSGKKWLWMANETVGLDLDLQRERPPSAKKFPEDPQIDQSSLR